MLRRFLFLISSAVALHAAGLQPSPADIYGELFVAVQLQHVFPDQKTFVDCVPREPAKNIVEAFEREHAAPNFDLGKFVRKHFLVPESKSVVLPPQPIDAHLRALWAALKREPDTGVAGSSLLPLPNPYIVPGGRFREVYYWDSYFTMLGLRASGENQLIESMIENFSYLEKHYGVIPNGNRTYFLSRSQPPFFSLMLDVLAEIRGPEVYEKYGSTLLAEHDYWMDRTAPTHHRVELRGQTILNRYFDQLATPRPEAYAAEEAVRSRSSEAPEELFRNLRAAAESGWDFSSRWFADRHSIETIETTRVLPIDLNCLLQHLELTLARAAKENGDTPAEKTHADEAERRAAAIRRVFWSESAGYFFDSSLDGEKLRDDEPTLAGMFPLFFQLATQDQADRCASFIEKNFLRPGGVVTTLRTTGQQWDAPNGWPPLEWITIVGLENYGHHALAETIARRWLALNRRVYQSTGKMMEKYDVEHPERVAGGGEYPAQDGFGWTNGVYLALAQRYAEASSAVIKPSAAGGVVEPALR